MTRVTDLETPACVEGTVTWQPPDLICAAIAAHQYGLISVAQALAAGLSRRAIDHRLRKGDFEWELPGVLALKGAPRSWERDLMAAVLWAGPGSAASGRAAARVFGFDGFAHAPLEVSTTKNKHSRGLRTRAGKPIVVHRVDEHLLQEIIEIRNILSHRCAGHFWNSLEWGIGAPSRLSMLASGWR